MASGLGGADWFEIAGRFAQAETDIGLGRILDRRSSRAEKASDGALGLQKAQGSEIPVGKTFGAEKGTADASAQSPNVNGKGPVFGPPDMGPSPPLKRHAAPLFKAGKLGSAGPQMDMHTKREQKQEQALLELDDVTSEQQWGPQDVEEEQGSPRQESDACEGEDIKAPADKGGGTLIDQEVAEERREKQVNCKKTKGAHVELPDVVGAVSEDDDADIVRDWSRPSRRSSAICKPHAEGPSPRDQTAAKQRAIPTNESEAPDEEGPSIWQFKELGVDHAEELDRRGALQMEELASPLVQHSNAVQMPPEPPQEAGHTMRPDNQLVSSSALGALANVPVWNLAQAGLLSTSIGQRVASFVGEVVAATTEHEQRFSGRLRSNSLKSRPTELKVLDGVPFPSQATNSRPDDVADIASAMDERSVSEAAAPIVANVTAERTLAGSGPASGAVREPSEASSADWVSRIQSATSQQLGEWLARVKTTYRGSKEDIGWLQREPGMPPVTDGTERFLQLLGQTVHGIHSLPDDYVYLLTPGLFSNFGPLYLSDTKKYLAKLGLSTHIAKIHSEAAVEKNALEICQYVEELNWGTGKQVVILGHSKGGIDACAALALFPERLAGKVRGIALVQSPYAGNPVCSDILREGQVADFGSRAVLQALMHHALKGELRALEDLTYEHRRHFILSHPLPPGIPLVSFHTEASRAPTALSAITTVGHAELPLAALVAGASSSAAAQATGVGKLPIAVPIGATLATIAGHLELRYGEKSDGLVTRRDAEVPGSVVVRPEKKLDHAWPVFGGKTTPGEAEPAHVNEALLTLLLESKFEPGHAPVVRPVRSGDPPRRWR